MIEIANVLEYMTTPSGLLTVLLLVVPVLFIPILVIGPESNQLRRLLQLWSLRQK